MPGFSLVEVTLALGIVSFGIVTVLGTLAVGLDTVRQSTNQAATTHIAQHLRGELQQISFKPTTAAQLNIEALSDHQFYYTLDGLPTSATSGYYQASFDVSNVGVHGADGTATFQPDKARNVRVTLNYPMDAPAANRQSVVFSIFSAKQKAN